MYGIYIIREEINPRTGKPWNLADVPLMFRKRTRKWLTKFGTADW